MPQSLSKVILHIILTRKIASLGSIRPFGRAYTLTWPQSAVTSAPNSCTSAVLLITFTLSQRYRELFPRLNSSSSEETSSKWIKTLNARYRGFFWQRGYGAFSVSPRQLDAVVSYVKSPRRAPS
jgi:hypothetical protein